jgi:hypothetical protein
MLLSSADRKASCWVQKSNQIVCQLVHKLLHAQNKNSYTSRVLDCRKHINIYMEPLETLEQDWISITDKGVR